MPTSRDIRLLNSATNYLLDVKPYHTKLRSLVTELFFEDRMTVVLDERLFIRVDLQGVWTKDDLGGWHLQTTSDGSDSSRLFRIPATIFDRFSITDSLDQGQTPVGNDPAIIDQTNVNPDGPNPNGAPWNVVPSIPDVHVPWNPPTAVANPTAPGQLDQGGWSHQVAGVDDVETGYNCGWFPVPWHHGSRVYVDGAQQEFGQDYYVDKCRGFIKFPQWKIVVQPPEELSVSAISFNPDTVVAETWTITFYGYDSPEYDDAPGYDGYFTAVGSVSGPQPDGYLGVPYDNGIVSFIVEAEPGYVNGDEFIFDIVNGIPAPGSEILINYFRSDRLFLSVNSPFEWNQSTTYDDRRYDTQLYDSLFSYSESLSDQFTLTVNYALPNRHSVSFYNVTPGSVKGTLRPSAVGTAADGEVWTITATGPNSFAVQRVFPSATPVETAFYGVPFDNSYISFTITNTWVDYYFAVNDVNEPNTYAVYDLDVFDVFFQDDSPDSSDFLANLDLRTEHGVVVDPLPMRHSPVQLQPWGYVTKVTEDTLVGPKEFYQFVFNEAPEIGSRIQFQVEQVGTWNIPAHVCADEDAGMVIFTILAPGYEDQPIDGWFQSYSDLLNLEVGFGSIIYVAGYDEIDYDYDGYDDVQIEVWNGFTPVDALVNPNAYSVDKGSITVPYPTAVSELSMPNETATITGGQVNLALAPFNFVSKATLRVYETGNEFATFTNVNSLLTPGPGEFRVSLATPTLLEFNAADEGKSVTIVHEPYHEVWTITFVSPTAFSVVGSLQGVTGPGFVGSPYNNGFISFTVTGGTVPYDVGDEYVLIVFQANVSLT